MSFNLDKELLLRIQANIEYIKEQVHRLELNNVTKLSEMNEVLIKQESNLQRHMARSDALEKQVSILQDEVKPVLDSLKFIKILFAGMSGLITFGMLYMKFKS